MEKRCYICGAVGFEELIATCMDCKSIFIHLYCMESVQFVIPSDWMCEDCHETPKQVASKFTDEVVVLKRAVKFIPKGEAIALASQSSPSKGKRHFASPEKAEKVGETVEVPTKRVEHRTNMVPLTTSSTRCNVHDCSPEKPSGLPMAEQNRSKKHSVHAHIPSAVPVPSRKQKSCIKDPVHARTPSSVVKPSPDLQSFKELFIPTHTASTKSRRGFAQGGDPYKGTLKASQNAREQRLSGEKLTLDRYLPNHPASIATWKGCFRTSGFAAPFSSYVTVWGYPPAKVGKKAYEFSKKMPDVLCFEAIPRCTVWANMFNDEGPDKNDIGLYFVPSDDSCRSEQRYSCLVSHLEKQDIVLKSCICGIELLIFSSSFLDEKSREINQAYYLWGLFVPPKFTVKEPDRNQLGAAPVMPSRGSRSLLSILPSNTNTEPAFQHTLRIEQDVDMEIDMLGGVPVGKIEVTAPKDSVTRSKTSKAVVAAAKQPASEVQVKPEKWDEAELASPPGFPATAAWVEPRVPPGFEDVGRVKYKTIDEILQSGCGR